MIAISENSLNLIRGILKKTVPNSEVRAFGSRVKGTNRKYSDLDLALIGKEKLGISVLGNVREAFMESTLPFRVDVLDYNAVSENFRKVIDADYERIDLA
ncbi:MAG: nucleotidyltransferase domain-containing protein [Candidatus Fibromonas sp.]|jgi:predicted nucleotidyltransferase|nr:nucleotidyltransferase domain-containing protein [Candidatus Fibromonas sp.]